MNPPDPESKWGFASAATFDPSPPQVWQDALRTKAQSPYMNHQLAGVLRDFSFCPYEDILAVGHSEGLTSMLVPGGWEWSRVHHLKRDLSSDASS